VTGPSATRIEVKHVADPLVTGFVRMAGDYHAATALQIDADQFDVVEHIKIVPEELQLLDIGKIRSTAGLIDIAANRALEGQVLRFASGTIWLTRE